MLRTCKENSSACADKGSFSALNSLAQLLYLHGVALYGGLVGAHLDGLGICKINKSVLNVHGDIYKNGTLSACACEVERFLENPGKLGSVLYEIAVLYKRLRSACDIHFLENIAAYLVCGDLTCDADKWDTVGISGSYGSKQVRSARSRCGYADSRLVGYPCISACRMACVGFMAHQNVLYIRAVKLVIKRTNGSSGVAEDDLDTLHFKTFNHCLSSTYHSFSRPFKILINYYPKANMGITPLYSSHIGILYYKPLFSSSSY